MNPIKAAPKKHGSKKLLYQQQHSTITAQLVEAFFRHTCTKKFVEHSSSWSNIVNWIISYYFFPADIFSSPNRVSDSVSDADSRDIKILVRFPGNPILEISIKIRNCVAGLYMRGCILMKVRLIACSNCPVILGYFLVWVYLIFGEPT